jgi:hypothetical protein
MTTPAAVPEVRHGFLPVLDGNQAADVVAGVDAEVRLWTRREMFPIDFYTLGAASYLDAVADLETYRERARSTNPALEARFGWLYELLVSRLSLLFGDCCLAEDLAYPGFHVFGHRPGTKNSTFTIRAMQALTASIHSDRQFEPHQAVWSKFADVDLQNTLTFTLALQLPRHGAGLCVWDEEFRCDERDSAFRRQLRSQVDYQKTKGVPSPVVITYEVGFLFYFMGLARHQIAPSFALDEDDRRITLQGHGVRCDGVWQLYF